MRRMWMFLTLAVALAGCGGGESGGSKPAASKPAADEQLKRAAESAAKAGSYRAKADLTSSGPNAVKLKGEMISTTDGSRSRIVGTVETDGQQVDMEMLRFGRDQFFRSDAVGASLPKGKEWTRVPDSTPSSSMPIGEFFEYLRQADGFERVGSEQVGGRPATRFGGPLDLDDFTKFAGPEAAAGFEGMRGAAKELDVRLDIWIDDRDLPSRMAVDVTPDGQKEPTASIKLDFLEFGVPTDFERPDPAKVAG